MDVTEDFESVLQKPAAFIKFYAPWCSHCNQMQPDFVKLSESLDSDENADELSVLIGMVNCDANKKLCQQYGVGGYPSLLLFKNGRKVGEYQGNRDSEDMENFIRKAFSMKIKSEPESDPFDITSKNVKETIKSGFYFVKYFAPWCGHCNDMKPAYRKLATQMQGRVVVAEVDCTKTTFCQQINIRGYPTLILYKDGNQLQQYNGDHSAKLMKQFLEDKIEEERVLSETVIEDIGDKFETVQESVTFVKFYAPWCSHCNEMQPEFVKLANMVRTQPNIKIKMVDCTKASQICKQENIGGYPTMKLFIDGKAVSEFNGQRSAFHFNNFIQNQIKEHEIRQNSNLVDLTISQNFHSTIKSRSVFISFCVPNDQKCGMIKDAFEKLSILMTDSEIVVAFVNCQVSRQLCSEQQVNQYPRVHLYENGEHKDSYTAQIDANEMRMWLLIHADTI